MRDIAWSGESLEHVLTPLCAGVVSRGRLSDLVAVATPPTIEPTPAPEVRAAPRIRRRV
jgi:hypothetical protein